MLRLAKLLSWSLGGPICLVAMAPTAYAQTTGGLRVVVFDEDGLEVPAATIEVSSAGLIGGSQKVTTGVDGEATFTDLPPGSYRVVVGHEHLVPAVVDNVKVKINATGELRVVLDGIETVIIDAVETPIESGSTSRRTVLSKEQLARLPVGQDPYNALKLGTGVVIGPGTGANFVGSGAANENTVMIDGFVTSDPVTGTFGTLFNSNAVEQIELLLGGYLPEVGGLSLGGVVNLVTQTGSNELSFNSSVFYANGNWVPRMDERIAADGLTLAPTSFDDSFSTLDIQARVSGPVVRDKAYFMLTYTNQRALLGNAGTPQRRDGLKHSIYGKLTVQPSAAHRFTFALQMDPTTIDNTIQGTPFVKASAQERQAQGGFASLNRWQWFVGSNTTLETKLGVSKTFIDTSSVPCTHDRKRDVHQCRPGEAEGNVDTHTPGRFGVDGAYRSVNATTVSFDDRWRIQYGTTFSRVHVVDPLGGKHDLKAGISGELLTWNNLRGVNGNVSYVDGNAVRYDPESFTNLYWIEYSGAERQRTKGSRYAFFLQDSWRPTRNLTVNFGTRYDYAVMRDDVGNAVIDGGNWGPRLHVAWDATGDGRTKLATGYGRYTGTGRLGVASVTSRSGFGAKLYLGENYTGDETSGLGNLSNQENNYSYDPTRNLTTANDRLGQPYTDEVLVIAERQLFRDVAVSSTLSAQFSRNLFEHDDVSTIYGQKGFEVVGSRYGDTDTARYRVRTPRLAKRDQVSWDVGLHKVWSRRWLADVSYSFRRSLGSSTQSLSGSFTNDPQTQFNYGRMFSDQTHVVRASFAWDVPLDPWTPQLGVLLLGASGRPVERFYLGASGDGDAFVARTGDRLAYTRLQPFWELSMRLRQNIPVRKGSFAAQVEVTNLTNNRASGLISTEQLASQNRYVVFTRQQAARIQVGATYDF